MVNLVAWPAPPAYTKPCVQRPAGRRDVAQGGGVPRLVAEARRRGEGRPAARRIILARQPGHAGPCGGGVGGAAEHRQQVRPRQLLKGREVDPAPIDPDGGEGGGPDYAVLILRRLALGLVLGLEVVGLAHHRLDEVQLLLPHHLLDELLADLSGGVLVLADLLADDVDALDDGVGLLQGVLVPTAVCSHGGHPGGGSVGRFRERMSLQHGGGLDLCSGGQRQSSRSPWRWWWARRRRCRWRRAPPCRTPPGRTVGEVGVAEATTVASGAVPAALCRVVPAGRSAADRRL